MIPGRARWAALPLLAMVLGLVGIAPDAGAQNARNRPTARAAADTEQPQPLEEETEHLVLPGETLGGIAHRAKVPRVLIIEANRLKAPYALHTGQKLYLPRTRHHVVKPGETGFDIAYRYGVSYSSIAVANGLEPNARLREGQKLLIPTVIKPPPPPGDKAPAQPAAETPDDKPRFLWPLEGRMRRGFVGKTRDGDGGDFHNGLDLVADEGEPVRTSAPGEVIFAGREPDSFGNLVVIDHGNGWQTAYGFLSKLTVKRGDSVKAHERVGLVGHSGRATRDELHFEIRRSNTPVNPLPLLPRREGDRIGGKPQDTALPDARATDRPVARPRPNRPSDNGPIEGKQDGAKQSEGKKPGKEDTAPKSRPPKAPGRN